MKVNYDEVMRQMYITSIINITPLEKIEWVRNDGSKIEVDPDLIKEFKYTGLGNINFAEMYITRIINGEHEEVLKEAIAFNTLTSTSGEEYEKWSGINNG